MSAPTTYRHALTCTSCGGFDMYVSLRRAQLDGWLLAADSHDGICPECIDRARDTAQPINDADDSQPLLRAVAGR